MGRPELQNRRTECEQAGLRCAWPASDQHAQDEKLRPQDRPAARGGGSAAGVQKDGGLPLDVPVTGEGGLSHYTRRGTAQIAAHSGARRMQACTLSRLAPHLRNAGAGERYGCENALRHAGPCVGGHHAGHLYPHHRRHAANGCRQHRPRHRQSSAAGGHFRAGAGNCPSHGGKAENGRLQALCGPQAQVRHRLRLRDQRPPLRGALLSQVARW